MCCYLMTNELIQDRKNTLYNTTLTGVPYKHRVTFTVDGLLTQDFDRTSHFS